MSIHSFKSFFLTLPFLTSTSIHFYQVSFPPYFLYLTKLFSFIHLNLPSIISTEGFKYLCQLSAHSLCRFFYHISTASLINHYYILTLHFRPLFINSSLVSRLLPSIFFKQLFIVCSITRNYFRLLLSSSRYLYQIPCLFKNPHHIHTTFISLSLFYHMPSHFYYFYLIILLLVLMIIVRDGIFTSPDHHPSLSSSSAHLMYPVKSLSVLFCN